MSTPEQPKQSAATHGGKPKILVADDDGTMRTFIRAVLSSDYDLVEAADGRQAIEILDTVEDIVGVISDDRMPHASGFEVSAHVRDTERLSGIPVILMTAKETSSPSRQAESRMAGAAAFLNKPFTRTQLQVLLGMLVKLGPVRKSA